MRFDAKLAAPELGAIWTEDRRVTGVFHIQGLMCRRPERVRFLLAQVKEHSPVVTGGVRTPARNVKITPAAIARARVGNHERILAVAEQMDTWDQSVLVEHLVRWLGRLGY